MSTTVGSSASRRANAILLAFVATVLMLILALSAPSADASAVDCVPANAPDRFGADCIDSETLPRRVHGSPGTAGNYALNLMIPPHERPETQVAGSCAASQPTSSDVSSHGAFVAFQTDRGMLGVPGNEGGQIDGGGCNLDVYVRSIVSHGRDDAHRYSIRLASADPSGNRLLGDSGQPSISANGRYVCFSRHQSGTPSGIHRKDMWTGELVGVAGVAGTCSVANDGKVAATYWTNMTGTVAVAWEFNGSDPVVVWTESVLTTGNPNMSTGVGPNAFSPGGRELFAQRTAPYSGNVLKVTFPAEGGAYSTMEQLPPASVRAVVSSPSHSSIGSNITWVTNNWAWNGSADIVRANNGTYSFIADSDLQWLPKYQPTVSDTEYWAYTGKDPRVTYDNPQNGDSETIYLSDSVAFDQTYSSGNSNACPIGTDAGGVYSQAGTTNLPTISGDGNVVAFGSNKPMLDSTGTSGPVYDPASGSYPRSTFYVRFAYSYEDCLTGDEDQTNEELAQRYAPYILYDKKEQFYSSDVNMFAASQFSGVGETSLKRCQWDFHKLGFRTYCGTFTSSSDVVNPNVSLDSISTGAASARDFLDLPGESTDARGKTFTYQSMRAQGLADAAYYHICEPPDAGCPDGKVLQYWLPYYQSWNAQSDLADGTHEGDWEMIQITFNANDKPLELGYASHETGYKLSWNTFDSNGYVHRGTPGGGEHPMVFPSRGAHGSYFESGSHSKYGFEDNIHVGGDYHELCAEGVSQPAPCRAVVPPVMPLPNLVAAFQGKWGSVPRLGEFSSDVGGPGGPGTKDQWSNPAGWQGALDWNEKATSPLRQTHDASGPVEFSYTSSDGKRAGSDDGVLAREIDGAMYDGAESGPSTQLRLPDAYNRSAGGTVSITGIGDGVLNFVSTIPDQAQSISGNYTYSNVSVTSAFRATLQINPTGVPILEIDYDGDGTVDEYKSPDVVEMTPIDVTPPGAVTNVRVRGSETADARVTWNSAGDDGSNGSASSYRVTYGRTALTGAEEEGEHSFAVPAESGSSQAFDVSDLQPGDLYYFEVRAVDDVGLMGPNSDVKTFRLQAAPDTVIDTGPGENAHGDEFDFTFHSTDPNAEFECLLDDTIESDWQPCSSPYTTDQVGHSGMHTFQVRSSDEYGNEDPTPAVYEFSTEFDVAYPVSKSRGPDGITTDSTPTFGVSGLHRSNRLVCKLDNDVRLNNCTSPYTTATLPDGQHTLQIWTIDASGGNASTPVVWNFEVQTGKPVPDTILDSAPPTTTITSEQAEAQPIVYHSTLPNARFECRVMPQYIGGGGLDYGQWVGWSKWCQNPYPTFTGYSHEIVEIRAVVDGAVDPTPIRVEYRVDSYGPDVAIVNGPMGSTSDSTPEFEFVSSDLTATFRCAINGAPFSACTSPFVSPELGDGDHSFAVEVTNGLGLSNINVRGFTVETGGPAASADVTPPDTKIGDFASQGPNNSFGSSNPILDLQATEVATFECAVDEEPFAPCDSYWSPSLFEGTHDLLVRAIDGAGNVDPTPATVEVTIDRTAPVITWNSPADGAVLQSGDVQFDVSATGAVFVTCVADFFALETLEACDGANAVRGLAPGPHMLGVLALDDVGNYASSFRNVTVEDTQSVVDTTIQSGPSGGSVSPFGSVVYSFSSSAASSTFECAFDQSSASPNYQPCTSPITVSGQGAMIFRVRATDDEGHVDLTPASRAVILDDDAVEITAPYEQSVMAPATTPIEFTGDPAVTTFHCDVDPPFTFTTTCASPWTAPSMPDGNHEIAVRASDTDGSFSIKTVNVVVDTTAPTVSFEPVTGTVPAVAELAMTVSDANIDTVQCRVDEGPWQGCGLNFYRTDPLSSGTHTAYAVARDHAGNEATAFVSFVVDGTPPSLQVTSPTTGAYVNDSSPTFVFSANDPSGVTTSCTLDGIGPYPCESPYEMPARVDGNHTLIVTATDAYGNSTSAPIAFTIDTVGPTTYFTSPSGLTSDSSPVMRMTFVDASPIASATCKLIHAVTYAEHVFPCVDGGEAPTVPDGMYRIYANPVLDAAGNIGTNYGGIVTIDSTGPQITITGPAPGSHTSHTQPSVLFTVVESHPGSGTTCVVDEGTANEQTFACANYTPFPERLVEGAHTLRVTSVDQLGNVGTAISNFIVDEQAPDTVIDTSSPESVTNQTTAAFSFHSTESGSTTQCELDGAGFAECTSPQTYPAIVGEGTHTFRVRAVDAAGNADNTPASHSWTVDSIAPAVSIGSPLSGASLNTQTPIVSHSIDDANVGSQTECSVAGSTTIATYACTSGDPLPALNEGPHTLTVTHIDVAGNLGTAAVTFTVDMQAPDTILDPPLPDALSNQTSATFSFQSTESGSTFECELDGDGFAPCESPKSYPSIAEDGSHAFRVRAIDAAGNVDTSPDNHTWTIDTIEPSVSISAPIADSLVATSTPTLTYAVSDANQSAQTTCVVSGATAISSYACASGSTLSSLNDGQHVLEVSHTDEAGNTSTATASFTVDATGPAINVTSPVNGSSISTFTPIVNFTVEDAHPGASTQCEIQGATTVSPYTCASGTTLPTLNSGVNTLTVTQSDQLGNLGSRSVAFTVDTVAPNTVIDAPTPASPTNQSTAAFNFHSTEGGSTFECQLDGASWNSCTSPHSYSGLSANTSHTFRVRATDAAGNTDDSPATHTWSIETVAPTVSVSSPTAGSLTRSRIPVVSYSVSDANPSPSTMCAVSGATSIPSYVCASGSNLPSLSDGVNTLTVTHTDLAGNATSSAVSFTVDATAPAIAITSPANGSSIMNDSPTLSYTVTETGSGLYGTALCSIDSGSFSVCGTTLGPLTPGTHTLRVIANDTADNQGIASSTFTVLSPQILSPVSVPVVTGTADNLTQNGTVDWSHWGASQLWNHKSTGGSTISNISAVSGTTFSAATGGPTLSWTDGFSGGSPVRTPSTTGINTGVAASNGVGRGFQFSVGNAQNTEAMSLRIHVGAVWAQGRLELWWSSTPGTVVTDTSVSSPGSSVVNRVFNITMRPPQANDTLNVRWLQNTNPSTAMSRVRLYGASLTKVGASRAAAPSSVNLSTDAITGGTMLDWAHWGGITSLPASPLTQIGRNATSLISAPAVLEGGGAITQATASGQLAVGTLFSWNDGDTTPTAVGAKTGIATATQTIGRGFAFTVPSATSMRTLKLYVGASNSSTTAGQASKLELFWGNSTSPILTEVVPSAAFSTQNYVYTINLRGVAAGTLLKVKWSNNTNNTAHRSVLHSASLSNN